MSKLQFNDRLIELSESDVPTEAFLEWKHVGVIFDTDSMKCLCRKPVYKEQHIIYNKKTKTGAMLGKSCFSKLCGIANIKKSTSKLSSSMNINKIASETVEQHINQWTEVARNILIEDRKNARKIMKKSAEKAIVDGIEVYGKLNFIDDRYGGLTFSVSQKDSSYNDLKAISLLISSKFPDAFNPVWLKQYNGYDYISLKTYRFDDLEVGERYMFLVKMVIRSPKKISFEIVDVY